MNLRLLSDLHLEGFPFTYAYAGERVLVLAGDIHTKQNLEPLLEQIPTKVQVLFVAGNHEYYHQIVQHQHAYWRRLEAHYPNFKWLDDEAFQIDDVHFFGGTMYSNFALDGIDFASHCEFLSARGIRDFYVTQVQEGDAVRPWSTKDHKRAYEKFETSLAFWLRQTEGVQKRVVISHFAPTKAAQEARFEGSALNGYFTVNMERFMCFEGLWLFGHTHTYFDKKIGPTRVISNAKGYGMENAKFKEKKMIRV